MLFHGLLHLLIGFALGRRCLDDPMAAFSFKVFGDPHQGGGPAKKAKKDEPAADPKADTAADPATADYPIGQGISSLPMFKPVAQRKFFGASRKLQTCHTFKDSWKTGECYSIQTDGFFWLFSPEDAKRVSDLRKQYDYMKISNIKLKLHHKLSYEVRQDNSPTQFAYAASQGNMMQIYNLNQADVHGHTAFIATNGDFLPNKNGDNGYFYSGKYLCNVWNSDVVQYQDDGKVDDKYFDKFKNYAGEDVKAKRFRVYGGLKQFASPFFKVKSFTPKYLFNGSDPKTFIGELDPNNLWKNTQLVKIQGLEKKELIYSNWKSLVSTEPVSCNLRWRYNIPSSINPTKTTLLPTIMETPPITHLFERNGHITYAPADSYLGEYDIQGFDWTPTSQGYMHVPVFSSDLTNGTAISDEGWPKRVYSIPPGGLEQEYQVLDPISLIEMPSRAALAYCTPPAGSLPTVSTQEQYTNIGHAQYNPSAAHLMFHFYEQTGWAGENFKFMSNFYGSITCDVEFTLKDDLIGSTSVSNKLGEANPHYTSALNTRDRNINMLPIKIIEAPMNSSNDSVIGSNEHYIPAFGIF